MPLLQSICPLVNLFHLTSIYSSLRDGNEEGLAVLLVSTGEVVAINVH